MKKPRKRPLRPNWEPLELRSLLSSGPPAGTWVGQDRHDLVGRSSTAGPSGTQDIHISLSNLPTDRSIAYADVRGNGGGQWLYQGAYGPWAAALVRDAGATTADLYIEPYQVETGRQFQVDLRYDDGTTSTIYFSGGAADPGLRMPDATAQAAWVGQDGSDRVGLGPSVGPDGRQDAVITLANLSSQSDIDRVVVMSADDTEWQYGTNALAESNAELIRRSDDPTRASLFVQPDRDLGGSLLLVRIFYVNGTTDEVGVVAGATDPGKVVATPAPLPLRTDAVSAKWLGQGSSGLGASGDVGLGLSGLPSDRAIVAATLTSEVRGASWVYVSDARIDYDAEPYAGSMLFRRGSDPTTAVASFTPVRDETGSILTLRVTYDDGSMSVTRLTGSSVDLSLLAPAPAAGEVTARPGDDLQALVNAYGTVRLSAGQFRLTSPLVLSKAVRLIGDPGSTILFDQPTTSAPWTAAIKIHQGNTTLQGFAVRFAGPVKWDWTVPYDPAVIGTTDPLDGNVGGLKANLRFVGLDLQAPPVVTSATELQNAPQLLRLVTAENGQILNNKLSGGPTQIVGGPWTVSGNTYTGAIAGTRVFDVIAGHWVHDVTIQGNVARSDAGSGKTYRFVVLTGSGDNVNIDGNTVSGIGPRDDDTVAAPNAPETILTEAYRVRFEGQPLAVSSEGRVVQIPTPQGDPIQAGDVLAVLSGPYAGQWRRVAQIISPTAVLLDSPLPTDGAIGAISISTGFVDLKITGNTIDDTGSSVAAPLVLVGSQFGTEVKNNRFVGGAGSLIVSFPSEQPVHWGWSHTPVLDVSITGNTFEDAAVPLTIGVDRNDATKSSKGRVYFEGDLTGNVVSFTSSYLTGRSLTTSPLAIRLGSVRALDPAETQVHASNNYLKIPAGVVAGPGIGLDVATLNGEEIVRSTIPLPLLQATAPTGLRLYSDTGSSPTDGLTGDARIVFDSPVASSYEYRLEGWANFKPLAATVGRPVLPVGLPQGNVTLWVRAVDATGQPGLASSLAFTYDSVAPAAVAPVLDPRSDTGSSNSDRITSNRKPVVLAAAEANANVVLLVDGVDAGRRTGPGFIQVGTALSDGPHVFTTRVTDAAGNSSTSPDLVVTIDTTAPVASAPVLDPGSDTGWSNSDRLTSARKPVLLAAAAVDDVVTLLVDGVAASTRTGPGALQPSSVLSEGLHHLSLRYMDPAGNSSTGAPLAVTIDATPPAAVPPVLSPGSDTGVSNSDRITAARTPLFSVAAAADEAIWLLADGVIVDGRIGGGSLSPNSPLLDGVRSLTVRLQDSAGNTADSSSLLVTIDATPPGAVANLRDAGQALVQFNARPDAVAYDYRLLPNGTPVSIGNLTTFRPKGLLWGANTVVVRAIDAAGNIGPEAQVVVNLARPTGTWVGQTTREDFTGPWSNKTAPDGYADVRINLGQLPMDHELVNVDIQGKGSGRWQFGNPKNEHWRVAVVRTPGASTASVYFQPGGVYQAREYQVTLQFDDGQSTTFYLNGGRVDNRLKALANNGGVGNPAPASSNAPANSWAQRLAAIQAARAQRAAQRAARLAAQQASSRANRQI